MKDKTEIIKYEISGDMKGLLGFFEDGTYYHIHSNELSKLEKWILNMFILSKKNKMTCENTAIENKIKR